jgi:hypothetical protein
MHSNTCSVQLPVVLISPAITYCPVVAKSAVSYKSAGGCGFFAAVCVMIFRVIDWQVCGVRWHGITPHSSPAFFDFGCSPG